MAVHEAGKLILIKLGDVLRISAPHCSILFSQTDGPWLAPFDVQGYPLSGRAFGEPHEDWPRWRLPGAGSEPHGFRWRSNDTRRPKGFRHDQARAIGARDPIAAFPFPAEARSTKERSQGPLLHQGPETVRRRAIPSSEAATNLTNYPWMRSRGRRIRKLGRLCSVRERSCH